jgi:hypothetical protein
MKVIIKEPDALRGYDDNGNPKAKEFVFDSDVAVNCEEVYVSFNQFGILCTKVKVKDKKKECDK